VPHLVGVFSNHSVFPNDHVILYHIPSALWEAGEADAAGEIAEVSWFKPDALPSDATPGTRRRVAALKQDRTQDDYW